MSGRRHNAKGRSTRAPRHIRLYHTDVMCTDAWRHLSGTALKVLLDMWRRHDGTNNGEIGYATRDGEEINLTRSTVSRALEELEQKGFIVCTKQWAFTQSSHKSRVWRLTMEPAGDAKPTREYASWRPDKMVNTSHQRDVSAPKKENPASHMREATSHQRDVSRVRERFEQQNNTIRPTSGTYLGSNMVNTSHQRDTYSLPPRGAPPEEDL